MTRVESLDRIEPDGRHVHVALAPGQADDFEAFEGEAVTQHLRERVYDTPWGLFARRDQRWVKVV